MNKQFFKQLGSWPKPFIRSVDLQLLLPNGDLSRYGVVKRALKSGELIHLRRGVYLVGSWRQKSLADAFEIAQILYGPSYISFESALSFHGWIPERVPIITSACMKRATKFDTPIGLFTYAKVPTDLFLLAVNHFYDTNSIYLIASPWRAVADIIYTTHRDWNDLNSFAEDLRIEEDALQHSDKGILHNLSFEYPNQRTCHVLKKLLNGLTDVN